MWPIQYNVQLQRLLAKGRIEHKESCSRWLVHISVWCRASKVSIDTSRACQASGPVILGPSCPCRVSLVNWLGPTTWPTLSFFFDGRFAMIFQPNGFVLSRFIEKYGTHIVVGVKMGGKEVVHIKQLRNSSLQPVEVQKSLKQLADQRFSEDVNVASPIQVSKKARVSFKLLLDFLEIISLCTARDKRKYVYTLVWKWFGRV